ncbi:MAG: recombinase zinc beta ribbon domain-containing protein [Elusimicrobia bacterium]|nr:recombinase zinc beta ribbon domain-containing protein [Elusimicrobiota bacterium]
MFNHVQALMAEEHQNTRKPGSSYHHLPYTGIIECRECRSNMSPSHTDKKNPTGDRRYFYYRCTSTNHKGWNACSTRQINASRMENIIHQNLIRLSRDPSTSSRCCFHFKIHCNRPLKRDRTASHFGRPDPRNPPKPTTGACEILRAQNRN